jgi:hypothetical protein
MYIKLWSAFGELVVEELGQMGITPNTLVEVTVVDTHKELLM